MVGGDPGGGEGGSLAAVGLGPLVRIHHVHGVRSGLQGGVSHSHGAVDHILQGEVIQTMR